MTAEHIPPDPGQENHSGYSEDTDAPPPPKPDYSYLFDAPNYSEFIKRKTTATSRVYEDKARMFLKAALIGSINSGNLPDAATIIKHGPGFCASTGALAEDNKYVAGLMDILTSPTGSATLFFLSALPFASQIWRNHEAAFTQDVPARWRQGKAERKARKAAGESKEPRKPTFTLKIPFIKKGIPVYLRTNFPVGKAIITYFKGTSAPPENIVYEVFSDKKVTEALHKMGVDIRIGTSEG